MSLISAMNPTAPITTEAEAQAAALEAEKAELRALLLNREATIHTQEQRIHDLDAIVAAFRGRRIVRAADALSRIVPGR